MPSSTNVAIQHQWHSICTVHVQYGEAPLGSVLSYHVDTFREVVMQTKQRGEHLEQAAAKKEEFLSEGGNHLNQCVVGGLRKH